MHRLREGRARGPALRRGAVVAVVVAAVIAAADQWTKSYVLANVSPGAHHLLGPLGLRIGHNSGVAFSLLSGSSVVALVVTSVLSALVAVLAIRAADVPAGIALGLLLGGALGNDVDRLARRGGVVDFLTLPHWATFNLADSAISVGAVLLAVLVLARRPVVRSAHR